MSSVAKPTTVKRTAVKKAVTKAEEVSDSVKNVVEQIQTSVEKKVRAPRAKSAPAASNEQSSPVVAKKSKSNAVYGDNLVRMIIDRFHLNEKEVRELINDHVSATSAFKKNRKRKDKLAPKKGLSSYMFFAADVRESIKKEFPTLPLTEQTKEIGKRWGLLSKEDRAPYEAKAAEDKERHARESAAYKETLAANAPVAPAASETPAAVASAPKAKRTRAKVAAVATA